MNNNLKTRLAIILAVLLACVVMIIGIPKSKAEIIQNWNHSIRLGLDLKGGSQLVLEVQLQDAFKAVADSAIDKMKQELAKAGVEFADANRNDPQTLQEADTIQINITGVPAIKSSTFRQVFKD